MPQDHPLPPIRQMVDVMLRELSPQFAPLYAKTGRPPILPEKLLRAPLLQMLYTIRSRRLLMEQLDYNLPFRWFVGLEMDDPIWDPSVFTKNRKRLLVGEIAQAFFDRVLAQARARHLLSTEHFIVDGTLIEAWAEQKSFKKKDTPTPPPDKRGDATVDFQGERRSNATHASTTDPEARLPKKGPGQEANLAYHSQATIENRHGLGVGSRVTQASGTAEREAALRIAPALPRRGRTTLDADKGYDTQKFVEGLRGLGMTPYVAQNTSNCSSTIDRRTTRHAGYAVSQRKRKRIEEAFGWLKTIGLMRKPRHRGVRRVGWMFTFAAAVYDLVRLRNIALVTP